MTQRLTQKRCCFPASARNDRKATGTLQSKMNGCLELDRLVKVGQVAKIAGAREPVHGLSASSNSRFPQIFLSAKTCKTVKEGSAAQTAPNALIERIQDRGVKQIDCNLTSSVAPMFLQALLFRLFSSYSDRADGERQLEIWQGRIEIVSSKLSQLR
jgi:hypothetical protein